MAVKHTSARPAAAAAAAIGERLDGWKAIAAYLRRDVRTVTRWETGEGLPIHRHVHKKRGTVYAYASELDHWSARRSTRPSAVAARRAMLAVLPFANLSRVAEEEYFSDGLTEEVLAQIGRLDPDRLGVIARTSVMQYKTRPKPIPDIGRELGVDYVLEGSVRRTADRVRVTAQLIHVADQAHLWAECYDRSAGDLVLLQAEIAAAIARQIDLEVTPERAVRLSRPRRTGADAHEAYLKGRFHWYKLSREHLDIALEYFQIARERDPGFALAYVGIAYVWLSRGDCGLLPAAEAFPEAKAAALKALELDDTLTEVHELLANIRRHFDWDWNGADAAFRHAIDLDPNYADGHFMYADFLISMGRSDEAAAEMRRALALDPLNFLFRCFLGWHLIYQGRYDEAIARLRDTLRSEPSYAAVHLGLWGALSQSGRLAEALAAAQRFFTLLGDEELAEILARGGGATGYARTMARAAGALERRARQVHVPGVRIARLWAQSGEGDRAIEWLETACERREPPLVHLAVSWDWQRLRGEPRFRALLDRLRFHEFRR